MKTLVIAVLLTLSMFALEFWGMKNCFISQAQALEVIQGIQGGGK